MKPLSLRLKGFIGVKKGLGLDELTLDLSGVSGLIALSGENGRSKSTVLENLHAFRCLFSRAGSLSHHTFLRDSEKEFTFQHEGHVYKTLVKIDAQAEKQEGFIWKDGEPQVNGKARQYDAYIEDLLGSSNLFASSVFCPQNSRKLTDMRTGELREMFAEFLRLDRLTGYEATAKQCISVVDSLIAQAETRIAGIRERMGKVEELQASLDAIMEEGMDYDHRREALNAQLREQRDAIDKLRETVAVSESAKARKADLQAVIDRMVADLEAERTAATAELDKLRAECRAIKADIEKCDKVLADKAAIEGAAEKESELRGHQERIEKDIEAHNADITDLTARVHEAETAIQKLKSDLKALDADRELREIQDWIKDLQVQAQGRQQTLKDLDNDFQVVALKNSIEARRGKLVVLQRKPEACQDRTCSFIVDALKASEELPVAERSLVARQEEIAALRKATEEAAAAIDKEAKTADEKREERHAYLAKQGAMVREHMIIEETSHKEAAEKCGRSTRELGKLKAELQGVKVAVENCKALSARLPDLRVAESRKSDLSTRLKEITEKGQKSLAEWGEKEATRREAIAAEREKLNAIVVDPEAEQKLKDALLSVKVIESEMIPKLDAEIKEVGEKAARVRGELAGLQEAEKELAIAEKEKERLAGESAEWTYLRNACSKTGLQAMEIDGVVPLLVADANRLLALTFGPSFTIRIDTIDEEQKEIFRVMVIRDDGEESLLDNLSGGQATWILKALRLSLTLLSKRKSGRNFLSGFADEIDGGLDVENAKTFISMYRAFMKEGGFESFYFISHKPECISFADHVLKFRSGGIDVE